MERPEWSGASGDAWARHWRGTDLALAGVGAALDQVIAGAAPNAPFRALDVGCGPGTTALALAERRADAIVLGCDLSEPLIAIARQRGEGLSNARFEVADAEDAARGHGPFELIFSRHGVMFFDDPHRAFSTLRGAATASARLVFSCFRAWEAKPWASELASAAAGAQVPAPGREPSGFAFAEVDYVGGILTGAGWTDSEPQPIDFEYVAGEGDGAVDQALEFLVAIGPASRVLASLDGSLREAAVERLRAAIRRHERDGRVVFSAAAWIWTARAP